MTETDYGTKWLEYEVIYLGGYWAFVIGIVQEKSSGEKKVRITKGKIKGFTFKKDGKTFCKFLDDNDPITQVNRLNIKSKESWEEIKKIVDKYLKKLEGGSSSDN
jgi:hypothetical protein